jgi:hypothetical protein
MQQPNLLWQILRVIPVVPVVAYHVIKELVEDLIKFFVRPSEVEWPEPSAATRLP